MLAAAGTIDEIKVTFERRDPLAHAPQDALAPCAGASWSFVDGLARMRVAAA
jgi:hypothetical protein